MVLNSDLKWFISCLQTNVSYCNAIETVVQITNIAFKDSLFKSKNYSSKLRNIKLINVQKQRVLNKLTSRKRHIFGLAIYDLH